jgi:TetR/AcrR family transcriptional regulator
VARAQRLPAQERRRRIIESARAVFAASNYWKVSTADLAKAAGVSEPALYRYFPSKKELFLSTLKEAAPKLLDIWQRIASEVEDPIETLWSIGISYYDHLNNRSAPMKLLFQALVEADDPDIRLALRRNFASFVRFFREIIDDGKRRGLVRPELDTEVVAWRFLSTGLTLDVIHLLDFDQDISRRKVEVWMRLFLDSLRPAEAAGRPQPITAAAIPYDHLPSTLPAVVELPS